MPSATQRETTGDVVPSSALCARVELILERGGLVALPTETVYGIAARADDPRALEKLVQLKQRSPSSALTWHVGSIAALERFPSLSPMARRLATRYWPGPLTLVLPGVPAGLTAAAREGWTGVRLPAQRATAGILERLEFPVVLSSANLHGEAPLRDADAIERAFAPALELIVDGGPSRLGEASSVVRLGPGRFELLREGLFTLEQLRPVVGLRIAFVCTGNTCRSPMAEGLARKLLAARLDVVPERLHEFGFELLSMGIFAAGGDPAARHAVQVMNDAGVDLSQHRARPALAAQVLTLDRVYCMTRSHLDALALMLPPGRDQHLSLLDPQGADVPDPIGGSRADYRGAAETLERLISARLDEWA